MKFWFMDRNSFNKKKNILKKNLEQGEKKKENLLPNNELSYFPKFQYDLKSTETAEL